ncbi:MAG: caspase family protein, partial [Gemmatimonadota bacterium]
SAMGIVRANGSTRVAVAPATLRGRVRWHDADGDGVLAPGEEATVTLTLDNDGPGVARAVRGMLRVESPSTGVATQPAPPVTIAAGQSREIVLHLTADSAQGATEIVVVARASEANGFDLAPALRLRIPARAAGTPRLLVRETRIDDASRDGRLAPREIADLTIHLVNAGTAATPPLHARLWRGADLFLAAGARDTFSLGALPAGGEATVTVGVYTNSRAADTGLRLELADPVGRLLARLPIALPVTGQPSGVLDVVATRDSGSGGRSPATSLAVLRAVDVERDLPRAAVRRRDAIAVILGIDRYRALPGARFAERDASLMRRYAVEALGINDDVEHLYFRTGADVTGGEMRKLFGETGWLARRVTANTDLVVYFAGHGAPDAARRVPFLLPFDADPSFVTETGFALGTLYDRLARLPARSITVILDACFTGLTRDGQALVRGARPAVLSVEHPALVRRQMSVITASREGEVAGDLAEAGHGLLTYWIARGLRGEADADADGSITVAELGRFAEFGVRETAARQDRVQRPLTIARDSLVVLARLAPAR